MEKKTVPSRILIVDDEEGIRTTLCKILDEAGYETFCAASGVAALEFLQAQPVDVVVTDIMMPGLNGLELTQIVKKQFTCDVIVITGYGGEFSYEEALARGASDFAQKPVRPKELIARIKRVLKERALIAERKQMEQRLRELTVRDDLTKLFNSRHFFEQIRSEIDRATRYEHALSLLLLDVDHFKNYNDNHGHLEGDKVLMQLGEVVRKCLRANDSGYRYGGDEFTVILPETRGSEAMTVAERIRDGFHALDFSTESGKKVRLSVSIGITEIQPNETWENLTKRADAAMYEAKKGGGNTTVLF